MTAKSATPSFATVTAMAHKIVAGIVANRRGDPVLFRDRTGKVHTTYHPPMSDADITDVLTTMLSALKDAAEGEQYWRNGTAEGRAIRALSDAVEPHLQDCPAAAAFIFRPAR